MEYYDQIQEAVAHINKSISQPPEVAVVLGSGLGNFSESIEVQFEMSYAELPHFPPATVKGHDGKLIFGLFKDVPIVAQSGRYHFYEGYDMKQVTFPIRVFKFLGVRALVMASAVGGIHENYQAGDVSVVTDHINLHHQHPLNGPNDERLGTRFPDMVDAYSPRLIRLAQKIASEQKITLHESIYAGLPGPTIETKAEYEYLHRIGATVVGMSTVPEIIVARHMELESCVFTAITNKCYPISAIKKVTHDEVIDVAQRAGRDITNICQHLIPLI